MNKMPQSTLTKTCSSCGLTKPLSAFLQLSDSGRSMYGNLCASCRKAGKDKPTNAGKDEGSSTSKLELKIDSKAKIKGDTNKKLFFELTKELDQTERELKEQQKDRQINTIQTIAKKERLHRETFLKDKSDSRSTAAAAKAELARVNRQFFNSEKSKNTVDYANPVLDTQIAGKVKHHTALHNMVRTWLKGKGTNFLNNVEKLGLADKKDSSSTTVSPEKTPSPPTSKKR